MDVRLRYWIANAKSGAILGEVRSAGSGQFTSKLGGGTCSATISLDHLTTLDGKRMDAGAVARTIGFLAGGLRSIVVTDHARRCLGEWVLLQRSRTSATGTMAVRGMEWAGYPALRSLNDDFVYTNVEQYGIARALLIGAFRSFNTGMEITMPTESSGVLRSIDRRAQTCYFSDALEDISAPVDGFEWHVDITGNWTGSQLTSVTRTIVFGSPTLSRPSDVAFELAGPGSRRGNAISIDGGDDFAFYSQSVYGIGSGEGEKQRKVGLSDPTLTNAGYLNRTKNVSYPDVKDMGVLTALVQAELAASQDLREPFKAVGLVEKMRDLPRVGTTVALRAEPTWAFPEGLSEQVRVGEVSYSPNGHQCSTVAVLAL